MTNTKQDAERQLTDDEVEALRKLADQHGVHHWLPGNDRMLRAVYLAGWQARAAQEPHSAGGELRERIEAALEPFHENPSLEDGAFYGQHSDRCVACKLLAAFAASERGQWVSVDVPRSKSFYVAAIEHKWECVAPEGGYYRWVCKNLGCGESVPYPSKSERFFACGPCKGQAPAPPAEKGEGR